MPIEELGESGVNLNAVSDYYDERLSLYGPTPLGVDWRDTHVQHLRFEQLIRIVDGDSAHFSVCDLGCGYGAFLNFMEERFQSFSYKGIDISAEMISVANSLFGSRPHVKFIQGTSLDCLVDYVVASGIFSVRLENQSSDWLSYLLSTLEHMNASSLKGFAFNCLTQYSDEDKMRDDLYYADPFYLFDFCKRNFSRHVALLHDYGLYEFTILVRKNI